MIAKRYKELGYRKHIDEVYGYLCSYKYYTNMTRKCKCGKSVSIFYKERRKPCDRCGRMVFLTKKDEFDYRIKRRLGKC